jgi:hypothetical protein
MSLPARGNHLQSPYLQSYRVPQGILHNPKSDRRTTQGIFHIVEGELPIPADKIAVPRATFAALWAEALKPSEDILALPFTADQDKQAHLFVSLLLRPIVCPATGTDPVKTMETRFFAPASLISNLDFVEGIFGNAGDPYLPENNAALDVLHWTGHTGCVLLAPHLVGIPKKVVGLPHYDDASERQRKDGMCWRDEGEAYNEGRAFKLTCRDHSGVMVTIIADNYYGYCKKEVKTQISFAANLFGLCEEEHAGGALAFASYVLGQDFLAAGAAPLKGRTYRDALQILGTNAEPRPEGYAVDRRYEDILYVPENAEFNVREGFIRWQQDGAPQQLTLHVGHSYVLPSGYKVRLEKQASGTAWRLVGSNPEGTLCHKPCTVSGGGKSEISKSIANVLLKGPVFVKDYVSDMDEVAKILKRDFSDVYKDFDPEHRAHRPILSSERSLGSVIKLLTPSSEYTDAHNDWLHSLPQITRQLVFTVKRYYRADWGEDWRAHFTVDRINGFLGHELKYNNQKLVGNYLRVGYDPDGSWRIYKLRSDFNPADKVQVEDDISASAVLPSGSLNNLDPEYTNPSVKLVLNCERLLFQRPDDAIYPGFDKQAELDIATPGTFLSNYEPLKVDQARSLVEHVVEFDKFTDPMKRLLENFVADPSTDYIVSSAHPRVVDGKPSKNPRYLQQRPDLVHHRETYLAEIGTRLCRRIPPDSRVHFPVNAVLAGRRNNPPDPEQDLPALAVYNPVHYQELPELFMDFVCSLTGKSPSTTGFGSEGALTKGPFNAVPPVVDLNNALVSAILTGHAGFTSAAGHVGPQFKVDHDISMLVPEIWCRMKVHEREPKFLIEHRYLEPLQDFEHGGCKVLASRLGYRITALFVDHFLGRIFETPDTVLPDEFLRPEEQDKEMFVAGVNSIVDAQTRVARNYFDDGSVEAACPPLRALLHVMVHGAYEGKTIEDPELRALFTREALLASDWYGNRLAVKQSRDVALWKRHLIALEKAQSELPESSLAELGLADRRKEAEAQLQRVSADSYLKELVGTIGADPMEFPPG